MVKNFSGLHNELKLSKMIRTGSSRKTIDSLIIDGTSMMI